MTTNECTYLVDRQLKKDRMKQNKPSEFKQVQVTSPEMAVIIRKNETKVDLASFLQRALFSPVKNTLVSNQEHSLSYMASINRKNNNIHLIPTINTAK